MLVARRGFLRGRPGALPEDTRPPWALVPGRFEGSCTRCGACVGACPTKVIRHGDGGFPRIDFSVGECSFCAECVKACEPGALKRVDGVPPWLLRVAIADVCLARNSVECRVCGDACDAAAIRFRPRAGGAPVPEIRPESCTGCGACVAPCPVGAITMEIPR